MKITYNVFLDFRYSYSKYRPKWKIINTTLDQLGIKYNILEQWDNKDNFEGIHISFHNFDGIIAFNTYVLPQLAFIVE